MIEDKLDPDERLRLECLAQSIAASHHAAKPPSTEAVIHRAVAFERYVRSGGEHRG